MYIIEQLIAGSGSFSPISYVEDDERFDQISQLSAEKLNVAIYKLMILEPYENKQDYLWHCQSLESGAFFLFKSNKDFTVIKFYEQRPQDVKNNFEILRA
ncbi:hypothetical protein [Gilvibacter sp.]|uniref:hypothetical protein n=1 Tax=Gilvibacter sp. TaxID=2729997 RepID=UPI003F4A7DAC